MSINVEGYFEHTQTPWGKLFYEIVWKQIGLSSGKCLNILDFGSGFGITANHYAQNHFVTAIEPNDEMLKKRITEYNYKQIKGSTDCLSDFANKSFDLIICHNALEYHDNNAFLLDEFSRLLTDSGIISIVIHKLAVSGKEPFKSIAFYKHIILQREKGD